MWFLVLLLIIIFLALPKDSEDDWDDTQDFLDEMLFYEEEDEEF